MGARRRPSCTASEPSWLPDLRVEPQQLKKNLESLASTLCIALSRGSTGFKVEETIYIQVLPRGSCVATGKTLDLSEPQLRSP